MMDGKARFASAVLVITLTIGILVDAFEHEQGASSVSHQFHQCSSELGTDESQKYIKLGINTASAEQLMALPGIGRAKANAILAWRQHNGPFASLDDLLKVKGIGTITLERIRPYCHVGAGIDSSSQ